MFIERRTEQKVDSSGRPTSESIKVFEIYPGLPAKAGIGVSLKKTDGAWFPTSWLSRIASVNKMSSHL